jgi:hypothetical protein
VSGKYRRYCDFSESTLSCKKFTRLSQMWIKLLLLAALFVVLTPGVVLRLPPGGSQLVAAVTHSIVFVLAWKLLSKTLLR